jgi:tetratricopeptide (TPR) repeat protein
MSDTLRLRTAIIGLIGFAAVEEEMLLTVATASGPEEGSAHHWAAVPLIAHNAELKGQQVQRLEAIAQGETPPVFAEIDHSGNEVYRRYAVQSATEVAAASRRSAQALVDELSTTSDEDLLDPSRHPWLGGRKLFLQIIVRGFWHPTGHLGEYYLAHGQADRAVALQEQAVAVTAYLSAPDAAQGMACYNLACAQARADRPDEAFEALNKAVELNGDLLANASRDTDLDRLREDGRLDARLGSQ